MNLIIKYTKVVMYKRCFVITVLINDIDTGEMTSIYTDMIMDFLKEIFFIKVSPYTLYPTVGWVDIKIYLSQHLI